MKKNNKCCNYWFSLSHYYFLVFTFSKLKKKHTISLFKKNAYVFSSTFSICIPKAPTFISRLFNAKIATVTSIFVGFSTKAANWLKSILFEKIWIVKNFETKRATLKISYQELLNITLIRTCYYYHACFFITLFWTAIAADNYNSYNRGVKKQKPNNHCQKMIVSHFSPKKLIVFLP